MFKCHIFFLIYYFISILIKYRKISNGLKIVNCTSKVLVFDTKCNDIFNKNLFVKIY